MNKTPDKPPATAGFILASASPARRRILDDAGLDFEVMTADVDEGSIRDELLSQGKEPGEIATALAEAKAEEVAARADGTSITIGADQILLFEDEIFEKPGDINAARTTLKRLRGKNHKLISAVVGYRQGSKIWSCREGASLTMRDFSDDFLEYYLQQEEGQLDSVGAYRIEGMGAQLFSRIEGSFFTILGLPLLPLLDFLRREGLLGK